MNELIHIGQLAETPVTMTSREIAELTGKRHDNVMRDTRVMLVALYDEGGLLNFEDTLRNEQNGQSYSIYRLPKRETLILVSGYDVSLRAKIIDRLAELELTAANPFASMLPKDYPSALRALADSTDKVVALEGQVEEMRPQVQALERIALSDGSLCITDAAKTLGIRPKELFGHMRAHHWIYSRQGGGEVAYQAKLQMGLLVHKTTTVARGDGTEKTATQVRVTPKGLIRLAQELGIPRSEPNAA